MMAPVIRLYTAAERDRDQELVDTVGQLLERLVAAIGDWQDDATAGWIGLGADLPSPLAIAANQVGNELLCAIPWTTEEPTRPTTGDIGVLVMAFGALSGEIVKLILDASAALHRLQGGDDYRE